MASPRPSTPPTAPHTPATPPAAWSPLERAATEQLKQEPAPETVPASGRTTPVEPRGRRRTERDRGSGRTRRYGEDECVEPLTIQDAVDILTNNTRKSLLGVVAEALGALGCVKVMHRDYTPEGQRACWNVQNVAQLILAHAVRVWDALYQLHWQCLMLFVGQQGSNSPVCPTDLLDLWFHENLDAPFPCSQEKAALAWLTSMPEQRVVTWFINKRARFVPKEERARHGTSPSRASSFLLPPGAHIAAALGRPCPSAPAALAALAVPPRLANQQDEEPAALVGEAPGRDEPAADGEAPAAAQPPAAP